MISQGWPHQKQYIDIRDREGTWLVALVLIKNQNQIKIRFDGWSSKYDETLPISQEIFKNHRIQPFRSHTRGYTGVKKNITPRQHWKFTNQDIEVRLNKVQEFVANRKHKNSEQLTQFIRGEHYLYIDFLLGASYHHQQDLTNVYEYFKAHIEFTNTFIQEIFQSGINSWLSRHSGAAKDEQDDGWESSYYSCSFQIFQAMYNIAGLNERLSYFQKYNEKAIKNIANHFETHENYISSLLIATGAFETIKNFIIEASLAQTIPVLCVYNLYELFFSIQKTLMLQNDGQFNTLLECIASITKKSFDSLSAQDVKTNWLDKQIDEVLTQIRFICFKHHRKQLIIDWIDQFRLKYYVYIINSNTIQRKFKGLLRIRQFCFETIDTSAINKRQCLSNHSLIAANLKSINLQELLFQTNQHAQFFKKSLDVILLLYRYKLIGLQALIYAWDHAILKQATIVKSLYKGCLQFTPHIFAEDISPFLDLIGVIKNHYRENKQNGNEAIEFYFQFVEAITKHFSSHTHNEDSVQFRLLQKFITMLIQQLYLSLLASNSRDNQSLLIETFSRTILFSNQYSTLIMRLYIYLTNPSHHNLAVVILYQVYFYMDRKNFFVPNNYSTLVLNCLKNLKLDVQQTSNLINLFQRILLAIDQMNGKLQLKSEQFKQFWQLFQTMPESKRNVFYEWIMNGNKQLPSSSEINQIMYPQLKRYILIEVLKEQNFADFENLSKRQLEIIIEFYCDVNQFKDKLQLKNYSADCKVYRLKSIETIKQNLFWSIFQKCKNTLVIQQLNKFLIQLHFYYAPSVPYNLKKGRVDQLVSRLKEYLGSAYSDLNTQMIKHVLMLLKEMIEMIKQQKHQIDNNATTIKLQISYDNKHSSVDVKYEDTISNIKIKLASLYKIKLNSLKMFNIRNQELSYDVKDVPIYCFSDKFLKIMEIPNEEETMTKFVYSLLSESMEELLFKMLQIEETVQQIFQLLEELEFKHDKNWVLQHVNNIIAKREVEDLSICKSIHYYYLLQIKIYIKNCQDQSFLQEIASSPSFTRLIGTLNHPISLQIQIHLIFNITCLLVVIFKKGIKFNYQLQVAQKCLEMVHQIYLFAQKKKVLPTYGVEYLTRIVQNANFLMEEVATQSGMLFFITSKKGYQEMLWMAYFSSSLQEVKMIMMEKIKKYLGIYKLQPIKNILMEEAIFQLYCRSFYSQLVFFFQNKQLHKSKGIIELFATMCKILQIISPSTFQLFLNSPDSFQQQIMGFIHSILQSSHLRYQQASHLMVTGHLSILKSIIQKRPSLKSIETINFILNKCLHDQDISQSSICRHPSSIKACFEIIKQVMHNNNKAQFFQCIMKAFEGSQKIMFWRNSNRWSIKVPPQNHKIHKGLINPGCICYMNSLLQQLFMIEQFRNKILAIDTKWMLSNLYEQNSAGIIQSMKKLFLNLMYSCEGVISAVPFSQTIKNPDKKPLIKINEQMDIDQFQTILFQKMQKQLQLLGNKNIIRQLFGGVYSNQIISLECSHRSQREESFISISLEVKKNIFECFKSFVKVDRLDGDNKYFCELCNKKVKAQKIQSIKKLPPYLILCLKRFQFNFQTQSKIKINNYCQFYHKLNLKQFSTQHVSRNWIIDEQNQSKQVQSEDLFNYKLRGVVIHSGFADSGHYYSFIEDKEGGWFQFNDEQVFPYDISKLPNQAFGTNSTRDNNERNAYLLIYEKQSKNTQNAQKIANKVDQGQQPQILLQNKTMIGNIFKKNQQLQKYSLVFSESYEEFIEFLTIKQMQLLPDSNQHSIKQQWYEFYLSYYFLILIRKSSFQSFTYQSNYLQNQIKAHPTCQLKYLKLFTSCSFINQFFVCNQNKEKCRIIGHIFSTAFINYINDTLSIPLQSNELFNHVLVTLKLMLITSRQIYELSMGLRRVLQHLADKHPLHLQYIVKHFSFQNIYLDYIFGNVIHSKQIEQFSQLVAENKKKVIFPFIPPAYINDKKPVLAEYIENWVIISILLKQANKLIIAQECSAVRNNLAFLSSLVSSTTNNKTMSTIFQCVNERGVSNLYQAYKQLKLRDKLCEGLELGLHDYQSLKYRPFMLLIVVMLRDPSKYVEATTIVDILQKSHKHNGKYFLQADLIIQWIARFLVCSKEFLNQFQSRAQLIDAILDWLEKTGPNPDHLKKHKLHSDKLLNRYYGILISSDASQYKDHYKALKKVYESVLDCNFKLKGTIHRIDEPLTPGKEVKFFDISKWKWIEKCIVLGNSFGFVEVKVQKEKVQLWQDSQKVKVSNKQCEFEIEKQQQQQNNSSLSYEDEQSDQQEQGF